MNNEPVTPVYVKLFEKKGLPTDKLVETVRNMSEQFNVYSLVTLEAIEVNPKNANESALLYSVNINPNDSDTADKIHAFLKQLWRELFNNYPAFAEPN